MSASVAAIKRATVFIRDRHLDWPRTRLAEKIRRRHLGAEVSRIVTISDPLLSPVSSSFSFSRREPRCIFLRAKSWNREVWRLKQRPHINIQIQGVVPRPCGVFANFCSFHSSGTDLLTVVMRWRVSILRLSAIFLEPDKVAVFRRQHLDQKLSPCSDSSSTLLVFSS